MGTSCKNGIIFLQSILYVNIIFPSLCETLYTGRVNLFAETSELFTHAVFQLVVGSKITSSESILQGAKKMVVGGC
jgi:hypothetical protein